MATPRIELVCDRCGERLSRGMLSCPRCGRETGEVRESEEITALVRLTYARGFDEGYESAVQENEEVV